MDMLTRLTAHFLSLLSTAGQYQGFLDVLVLSKCALELWPNKTRHPNVYESTTPSKHNGEWKYTSSYL